MNLVQKQGPVDGFQQDQTQGSKMTGMVQAEDVNRNKPNLLRINADNQGRKFLCIFWSFLFIFVIALSIVAKKLPSSTRTIKSGEQLKKSNLKGCDNPNYFQNDVLKCGQFTKMTPSVGIFAHQLSSLNQFVLVWLKITPKDTKKQLIIEQEIRITFYDMIHQQKNDQKTYKRGNLYQNQTTSFLFTSGSTNYIYGDDGTTIVSYKTFIGFLGQFPSETLYINMQFLGMFDELVDISNIQMEGFKIAKSFTQFTIALRYVFFVLSLLAAFLYIRNYRKMPQTDRTIQQKLIAYLSVLLIFFNDPLYPVTVLKQNMASSFFSTLFVLVFIVYLIFMWVIFYDRIYYEQGMKQTQQITWFKIAYFSILLVQLMVLYMLYASFRLNDHPIIPSQSLGTGKFLTLDTVASIWFVLAIIYIGVQYIRICFKPQQALWRNQAFMLYSILFQLAMVVFVLTDNALGSYSYDGNYVIMLYGLMNLYTWYLQYMYTPTKQTVQSLDEKRSLHSNDEMMSVETMEFNDLNINMDDNVSYEGLGNALNKNKSYMSRNDNKARKNSHENDEDYWEKPIIENKIQEQDNEIHKNMKNFSLNEQEQQHMAQKSAGPFNSPNKPVKENNFNQTEQTSKQQQTDFFNQEQINKFNQPSSNNSIKQANNTIVNNNTIENINTNLLSFGSKTTNQMKKQERAYHPQQSQFLSQVQDYITADNLQKAPQVQGQKGNQQNEVQEGFGDFSLD